MPQLFISHIQEDQAIAVEIGRALERRGFSVWYYERDTVPGPPYIIQIMSAIEKCEGFILIVSQSSMGSHQVDAEVTHAYDANKKFVPVLSGVSHEELKQRMPLWNWAIRAATSIVLPPAGVSAILDALESGVKMLGLNPEPEQVTCSVYAHPEVAVGDAALFQIWLHTSEQSAEVGRRAEEFDAGAQLRSEEVIAAGLPPGTPLRFKLEAAGLSSESLDTEAMTWDGRACAVNFVVEIPEESRRSTVLVLVTILREDVPVEKLRFMVRIKGGGQKKEAAPVSLPQEVLRHQRAYLCYTRSDQAEVLMRAQVLSHAGISVLMDSLEIAPGQDWQTQVNRMIDVADVFFLFWSQAAAQSQQVRRELLYALELQKRRGHELPRIVPVALSAPPPPPPPELATLHFDDRMSYFIEAARAAKVSRSAGESPAEPSAEE